MNNLLTTAITISVTVVVTTVLVSHQVGKRMDREAGLREQLDTRLLVMSEDIAGINERLDELARTQLHVSLENSQQFKEAVEDREPLRADTDAALRELVRDLIEEERAARHAEIKESQWKRLRTWQEDRDGPYGSHNVRIKTMSRSLDLDHTQASYYYTLLTEHEAQANALYAAIGGRLNGQAADPDSFQALLDDAEAEKQKLDESLDQAFIQSLSAEQASYYRQLPPEERGVGPNAGLSQLRFELSDLGNFAAGEN